MPDGFGDSIAVFQNVAVPETQRREALLFQICVTPFVILAFGVLRAISLNNQTVIEVDEVDNVAVNDDLPFEFIADQSFGLQYHPKTLFGLCRVETHPFGAGEQVRL